MTAAPRSGTLTAGQKNTCRRDGNGNRIHRARQHGRADEPAADRGRPQAHGVRHAQGGDGAAGQARRNAGALGRRRRRPGRDGDDEPSVARHRLQGRVRRGGPHARQPHQALRRSFDDRLARRGQDRRGHAEAQHRADRLPGERRRRRRRKGHAGGDDVRPEGGRRAAPACARSVRQGFLLRRAAGPRPEHEARQQLPVRHRHGGELGGDRDGRQGRARPEPDVRRDQCRQRHEHRDHAEVSALGAARHVRLRLRHGA